jgi:uroporphyrin-III C-methyltransferase
MARESSHKTPGRVWLIGAGPGDPELLTLKAVRALQEADVVLVDDLVDRRVLAHARPGARVVQVGKRGGCRSTPQAFIERLMVRLARRGAAVARLKGGDPFVFGRGGEEITALQSAGIHVEVVPGVTAALGAAAALGIPATHRKLARSITLVTGHARDGAQPDWRALRAAEGTLAIYMGIARIDGIAAGMLAGGFSPDVPACAIHNATLPGQRTVFAPLAALPRAVRLAGLTSPTIVIVGEVVREAAADSASASADEARVA